MPNQPVWPATTLHLLSLTVQLRHEKFVERERAAKTANGAAAGSAPPPVPNSLSAQAATREVAALYAHAGELWRALVRAK